jgi:hypothetical protein
MKSWLPVLIVVVVGIGGVLIYREAYVSKEFKEKAELAIDALETATNMVCDDDLSYIPASVAARFKVEEACAASSAPTTASLRISMKFRIETLDAEHHGCMLEQENQKLDKDIQRQTGHHATATQVPNHSQKGRQKIAELRKKLQDLP